ncbi:cytochrome P450 [Tothia fuscella]|uniref:Cytochrome P450 n=1 Tax=Tothia fuscella TaxID=1048955 RepID=A0A9P4U2S8_9PEZI|nr:cytochrome P450 [Tothia fuscella]
MGLLENVIGEVTTLKIVLLLLGSYIAYSYTTSFLSSRKIDALGGRASKRTSRIPLGLDLVYEAITHSNRNELLQFWLRGFQKYGNPTNPWTLESAIAGDRFLLTADPENIKAILATQFNDYGKGEQFNKDFHEFLGDSIFTTDGAQWHDSRQLIRPQFIKDRLSDIDIFEKHCRQLIPMLGGQGQTIDVADLFFRFTLDAATDFLLGRSVDSLKHEQVDFAYAFNKVQHVQGLIARAGPLNWIIPRREFRKQLKVMNEFTNQYIDEALQLSPEELQKRTKNEEGYTFLHALAGFTRDRVVLRDQLVAVLLAGRDTTACTLSWMFYELSKCPHMVAKLRREVLNTVGEEKMPSYADLKSMKYLQHCLNETLRIYPIVPFNVRLALKDTTLPHGGGSDGNSPIGILKGTPVGYSPLVMQRREDIYPPISDKFPPVLQFEPDRWDHWTPKPWAYIPFNGGPRLCVGQQFALTEMAYTVARIMQNFDRFESRMDKHPGLQTDIVLMPSTGVQVAFFEAAKV